jgi:DegV family protein with EDD domain
MYIVADCGADLNSTQLSKLKNVYFLPLLITLEGKTYASGVDIQPADFYKMLSTTESYPITSQPSSGDFADLYRRLAKEDPEILSIHISSGLSGTINAARAGASMVPEAKVTIVDTKTLSCPEGWQVEAASRALEFGWPLEKILDLLMKIGLKSEGIFTLNELRYLVHGGRISHMKGILASLLNIKPIIGVERDRGTYISNGQEVTFKRAIQKMVDHLGTLYPEGTLLRVQPLHGNNPEGVNFLIEKMNQRYSCKFEEITPVAPVLGAHTGPTLVGMGVGPLDLFAGLL